MQRMLQSLFFRNTLPRAHMVTHIPTWELPPARPGPGPGPGSGPGHRPAFLTNIQQKQHYSTLDLRPPPLFYLQEMNR